ncbi:MAG: lysophospholipase [Caldilinea sp.]|nr:lysophospholipase [Caldilinea sp.]
MEEQEFTIAGAGGAQLFGQCWRPEQPHALVVLVHGFGEHSGRYSNLVPPLTAAGYAVYALDHRGHGRSPGQRGHIDSFDDYLADVRALIESAKAAQPGLPVVLFGHSMGGLIVLVYAIRSPAGLTGVVASAPMLSKPNVSPILLTVAQLLSRVAPSFALDTGLDPTTISRDPAEVARYASDPQVHAKSSARAGSELMKAVDWAQAHAGELAVPLLLYHGDDDKLVSIEGSRRFFASVQESDRQFVELPGRYHESHNDSGRDELFAMLVEWLNRHTVAG